MCNECRPMQISNVSNPSPGYINVPQRIILEKDLEYVYQEIQRLEEGVAELATAFAEAQLRLLDDRERPAQK